MESTQCYIIGYGKLFLDGTLVRFNQFTPRIAERFMHGREGVTTLFQGQ